jgi:broad specificity phosphatase PhoE
MRALRRIAAAVPGGDVLVVTHGGLVYAVEQSLGAEFRRMANTEGRWVEVGPGSVRLGERVVLSEPQDTTVPNQI